MLVSLLVHGMFGAAIRIASDDDDAPPMNLVDVTLAPEAPEAELLGPDEIEQPPPPPDDDDVVAPPEPPPEPPKPPEPPVNDFALDAGVPDAAPPDPVDAATAVTKIPDEPPEPTSDAGVVATRDTDAGVTPSDAGVQPDQPASAATAANLLAHFPNKHMVSVLLRFDRLRGTEWSEIMQRVLASMPDYKTLIADPKTVVADKFDIVAMSSARYNDAGATVLAMKTTQMTLDQLRDFLDEPDSPVTWSRVTGGVLGTRGAGARVRENDTRMFLSSFPDWTVLAKAKDLKGAIDPAEGDLDTRGVDYAKLPKWLVQVPKLEAESGMTKGPAVLLTLAPKSTRWELPMELGGIKDLPAPERMSLTATLDPKGFLIMGHLKMRSEADAEELAASIKTIQGAVIADDGMTGLMIERMHAKNAIDGLTVKPNGDMVSYATSISIEDARKLFDFGATLVEGYFAELSAPEEDADPPP